MRYEMDWVGPHRAMPIKTQVRDAFQMKYPNKTVIDCGIELSLSVDNPTAIAWVETDEDVKV